MAKTSKSRQQPPTHVACSYASATNPSPDPDNPTPRPTNQFPWLITGTTGGERVEFDLTPDHTDLYETISRSATLNTNVNPIEWTIELTVDDMVLNERYTLEVYCYSDTSRPTPLPLRYLKRVP